MLSVVVEVEVVEAIGSSGVAKGVLSVVVEGEVVEGIGSSTLNNNKSLPSISYHFPQYTLYTVELVYSGQPWSKNVRPY